jgi:hypothetical protein
MPTEQRLAAGRLWRVDCGGPDGSGGAKGSGSVVGGGMEGGGGGGFSKPVKILQSEGTERWARGKKLGLWYEPVSSSVRLVCSFVNQ